MPSSLNGTGVTFNDATTLQSGNIPAANLGSGTANSTTFLRGDKTWQEVSSDPSITIINTQIFTASGTWTKPTANADDTLIVACIGGGGSGGAVRTSVTAAAGGGAGGGVALASFRIGDLPATVAVTVGSGGTARTATGNNQALNGNNGGASSFALFASAFGGQGGRSGVNSQITEALGGIHAVYLGNGNGSGNKRNGGNGRNSAGQESNITPIPVGLTGGGGAAGHSGATNRPQNYAAATGRLFGDGGNGAQTTASAGTIPGGGGGGASTPSNASSGAGARGEVRTYVVRGRVSAAAFFGVV